MAAEGGHESHVGGRELRASCLAHQDDAAPRSRIDGERASQLVVEAVRAPQLALSHAALEMTAGRLAQDRSTPPGRKDAYRYGATRRPQASAVSASVAAAVAPSRCRAPWCEPPVRR